MTSQTFFFETLLSLTQISKLQFKPFLYDYAAQISDSYVSSASKIFFQLDFFSSVLNTFFNTSALPKVNILGGKVRTLALGYVHTQYAESTSKGSVL